MIDELDMIDRVITRHDGQTGIRVSSICRPKPRDFAMATVHSALTDLLDPLGDCMTPEVARQVVQLRSSADANSRMQLLAGTPRNLP